MRLILILLRPVFFLLYHQFAWSYDLVAWLVSCGRWKAWVLSVLPRLHGRVLEIGFGPGHLQLAMHQQGFEACGVDESIYMLRQAGQRLRARGSPPRLVGGRAQHLPFPGDHFDSLVATFPAESLFDDQSLAEMRRVLRPGGQLLLLPGAWFVGGSLLERTVAWIARLGSGAALLERALPVLEARLKENDLECRHEILPLGSSRVLLVTAVKQVRPHRQREERTDFG